MTLAELLHRPVQGDRGLAVFDGHCSLRDQASYRDIAEVAEYRAHRMPAAGLRPGDRVAVVAETTIAFVQCFFAAVLAGLQPVPLPLPQAFAGRQGYVAHVRRMILAAGAKVVIAPAPLQPWIDEAIADLDLIAVGSPDLFDGLPESGDLPRLHPDQIAYLQFSSGSTRAPLGIKVTHRALLTNLQGIVDHGLCATPRDHAVSWLPFYHDMGLVGFLLAPMAAGVSVDYLATEQFARRPLAWLELIARRRGTISYSPSFGYALCARRAEAADLSHLDLSSWRAAGIGGEMIRPHALRAFSTAFATCGFDPRAFVASYGLAEATLAVSFAPLGHGPRTEHIDLDRLEKKGEARLAVNGDRLREFMVCGQPLPGVEVEIRQTESNVLGPRRVGRVYVRGPSVITGYADRPEATATVLDGNGWLDTGDLGYWSDEGLVIVGRVKDLIIVNGRNIWPQDLEWTAERTPGLHTGDVAAFGVDDGQGEAVAILVQCRNRDDADRIAMVETVRSAIRAEHGVEAKVVLVPPHSLPQTSSGKLSRVQARSMFLDGAFTGRP